MASAELISPEALSEIRKLDDLVHLVAREFADRNTKRGESWSAGYLRGLHAGFYDNDDELVTLRDAIRRGIEIGRSL